jgi:chromosome segregation ATPase
MAEQIGDIFNTDNDECLRKQFESIDKLPEHEVRVCCKKICAELRASYIQLAREREGAERRAKSLESEIERLRDEVKRRNQRIRELFDL